MKKLLYILLFLPVFLKAQDLHVYPFDVWNKGGNALGNNTSWLGCSDNFSFAIRTNNVARLNFSSTGYVWNKGVGGDIDNTVFGNLAGGTTFSSTVEGTTIYGYKTGNAITTGIINSLFGAYAGQNLTTGNNNTIFGYGNLSAASNTSNIGNTIIGYNTGQGITTGNYNTILGASNSVGAVSNNIVLSDGQGNIKYRWDGTNNTITGPLITSSTHTSTGVSTLNTIISPTTSATTWTATNGAYYHHSLTGHSFVQTDNNNWGLTVRNGTNVGGIYVSSSGSQSIQFGSYTNSNIGFGTNNGVNAMSIFTNNCIAINKPTNSYNDPTSLLEIRATSTTNTVSAFTILNSADNAKMFSVFNDGHVAIGATNPIAATLRMSANHTGGGTATGIFLQGTIAGDVTTAMRGMIIQPSYTATSASVGTYLGMLSGTPGVGTNTLSSLTYYDSGTELTNVTGNTYGYFSRISTGTNRYNFYANGTADNYFAGSVGIATTTPTEKLHVIGNGLFSGTLTSPTVVATGFFSAPNYGDMLVKSSICKISSNYSSNGDLGLYGIAKVGSLINGTEKFQVNSGGTATTGTASISGALTLNTDVIYTATYTMSAAEIKAGTQCTLVAAPGAGKYVEVIQASFFYTYGTAAFTNSNIYIQNATSALAAYTSGAFLTQTASENGHFINFSSRNCLVANSALIANTNTTSATGDGTVKISVMYRIITI